MAEYTCNVCQSARKYVWKEKRIVCRAKNPDTSYFKFTCSDSPGGIFEIYYGDLATNCPGTGSLTPSTPFQSFVVNGAAGTLNLSWAFCGNTIPINDDPKHPPGLGLQDSDISFFKGTRRTDHTETYDVKVIGARLRLMYLDDLDVCTETHFVDPFNPNQVKSVDFPLVQGARGKVVLNEDFARAIVLPDHPSFQLADLPARDVEVLWVTALMIGPDERRIDVALHDPNRVVATTIADVARGAVGSVTLTERAWASEWNLPSSADRLLERFNKITDGGKQMTDSSPLLGEALRELARRGRR
jgi:hypothetical protein